MKYCRCDDKYKALELEFIFWYDGKYYIKSEEQEMQILWCPFCAKKLNGNDK